MCNWHVVLPVPLALSVLVEPHDGRNLQLFFRPKYGFTDLHVDSADGISSAIGSCGKQTLKETFQEHVKKRHWWGKVPTSVKNEKTRTRLDAKKVVKRKAEDGPEEREAHKMVNKAKK